jgi:hypothetical protein
MCWSLEFRILTLLLVHQVWAQNVLNSIALTTTATTSTTISTSFLTQAVSQNYPRSIKNNFSQIFKDLDSPDSKDF